MENSSRSVLLLVRRGIQFLLVSFLVALPLSNTVRAQTQQESEAAAAQRLQGMTQEEIEARLKAMGMTMADAELKAKEMGIDLKTFLQLQQGAMTAKPAIAPEPAPAESLLTVPADTTTKPKVPPAPRPKGLGGLPYFGYDIFGEVPAAFEPTASGPVDPEYLVGPGDVLRITVWGQVEIRQELTVDKEGRIFIPTIGQILVAGQTLEQATQTIKREMSRSYSGLVARPPTAWLDVTVARLRPNACL